MPRFDELSQTALPKLPESLGFRHFGDGIAGRICAARIQGYDSAGLQYLDLAVDASGQLKTVGGGGGGGGGIATQGARDATVQPWWVQLHDGTAVYIGAKQGDVQEVRDRLPAALDGDGGLKVHQQNNPALQPVSDNGGSLTVDAPIGTPLWVRESDGAAAFVGQKAMAASKPVVIASDQSALPVATHAVTDGGGSLTVDGTVTANAGAGPYPVSDNGGSLTVDDGAGSLTVDGTVGVSNFPAVQPVSDNAGSLTVDSPVTTPVFTRLSDGAAALVGQKAMAASLPVVVASDQSAVPTTLVPPGASNVLKTGTLTTTAVTADQVVLTYTVTAAKTFYIEYLIMYGRLTVLSATATILGAISLESPVGTKLLTLDDVNPTTSELEFNPIVLPTPVPIAAGVVVRVVVTPAAATSMLWRANFGGYEK